MHGTLFLIAAVCLLSTAFSFTQTKFSRNLPKVSPNRLKMSVFDKGVKLWADTYPMAYEFGWGPTSKAERWNGRHAMFGWVALIATGYAKSHNLIPDADMLLSVKEWGSLAYTYGGSITNERAIILIAHLHLLIVSFGFAFAPLSFQDKLFLDKDETLEPAAGLIPKINPGLTKDAELLNGRLAMLGIVVTLVISTVKQMPILDVINAGLGGLLL